MEEPVVEKVCAIREQVAQRVGANPYRTWFGGSTHFQLTGDRLDVTVANAFIGNWITSRFMNDLVAATRDVVGGDPSVAICVAADSSAGARDAPEGPASTAPMMRAHPPPTAEVILRRELEDFVVGPSNELAFSVANAVARAPGEAFKHLVIHGGSGLGKTHLLQGLCNALTRRHPSLHWCYLSGEEFTNEFIYAVKANRLDAFRKRFRQVDLLVIDDIHFLANKKGTQDEFQHTFDAIDASGKAVVLSSDTHPRSISSLSEKLLDRMIAAMIVRIDPPDYHTRREILRRRARSMLVTLPDDVLDFVARHVTRNVRELEGTLYKLAAIASLMKEPLGLDLARRAVEDYVSAMRPTDAPAIERMVAAHFGVTRDALHSRSRDRNVTTARSIAMYLIRKHTRLSLPEIGRLLGNKQHSTVLMAVRRIDELLNRDGAVAWKTPAGPRSVPGRELLEELEQRLALGPDAH